VSLFDTIEEDHIVHPDGMVLFSIGGAGFSTE
jgi:hypothetical protein